MAFYKDERVALFIDGISLYNTARALGLEIDFRKLLNEFRNKGRLLRANYYTTLIDSDEYSPIRPLVDWLSYNGFNVVKKSAKEFTDREGNRRTKGNMRIEIAIDMMLAADHVDHVVLFSGDGDFRRAVEGVKNKGVRVSVISSIKSQPQLIAHELRREADSFIDLAELSDLIARPRRDTEDQDHHREHDYDD